MKAITFLPFLSVVITQSVNDSLSIAAAAKKMASNLMYYYTTKPGPDGQGAIMPSTANDETGQQWYESGIFWGAIMEYQRTFNDNQFADTVASALSLASGKSGSFLGDNTVLSATLFGKWNDDIGWWGMSVLSGAEIYGNNATLPSGNTYLKVAVNTYNEMWQQWDNACGGGIYWSRDRNSASKGYKSTITNAQHLNLGVRLYMLTKNQTYLNNAKLLYNWLKSSGVFNANTGAVYDGIDSSNGCRLSYPFSSYIYGTLIGSLGWYYKATNDTTALTDGNKILRNFTSLFVNNGVVTDPCETDGRKCKLDQVQPKGTGIRGLGYFGASTSNSSEKKTINDLLSSSVTSMLATCTSNMDCGALWLSKTKATGSDFHTTEISFELLIAYRQSLNGIQKVTFEVPGGNEPEVNDNTKNLAIKNVCTGLINISWILIILFN